MKWETARKYLHSMDIKNIKYIAKKEGYKLSGKSIDSVFEMLYDSEEMTFDEVHSMERRLRSSIGY